MFVILQESDGISLSTIFNFCSIYFDIFKQGIHKITLLL